MNIQMNKDFLSEYKNDVWKGFDGKELIALSSAVAMTGGIIVGIYLATKMSPATAVYLAIPFAIPVILLGFYSYQKYLPVEKLMREILYTCAIEKLSFATNLLEKRQSLRIFSMSISIPPKRATKRLTAKRRGKRKVINHVSESGTQKGGDYGTCH